MTSLALINIHTLVTNSKEHGDGILGELRDCSLVIENGFVAQIAQGTPQGVDQVIDCAEKTVIPEIGRAHV